MNEHEPTEERRRVAQRVATTEELSLATTDPILQDRWEEGLRRYGHAFAAYARLGEQELRSPDVLLHFYENYVSSYPDMATCIQQQVIDLNWETAYRHFLDVEGISEQLLHWDQEALKELVKDVYNVVEEGGEVHLFAK